MSMFSVLLSSYKQGLRQEGYRNETRRPWNEAGSLGMSPGGFGMRQGVRNEARRPWNEAERIIGMRPGALE